MKYTAEMLKKAKEAESAQALLALAKETGIDMTPEEAEQSFAALNGSSELADVELNNVAGGCGNSLDDPLYKVGEVVHMDMGSYLAAVTIEAVVEPETVMQWQYDVYIHELAVYRRVLESKLCR